MRTVYRHAGPRRRTSWWRGPWPPAILIAAALSLFVWELSWALPIITGG